MASNPTYEESKEIAEASREADWTKPSFGKNLFLGAFKPELIHPQPESPPDIVAKGDAYLERLKAFLVAEVDPLQIEADAKIPEQVIEGLKGLGALGMKIPEEYGGLGLTQVYYNKALALVGTWHSSLATLLSAHQSIGLPEPLRMFGTEEQKREWLPKVSNTHISAFLLTEPDVGSDPARMTTAAVPTADGQGYEISGIKLWATNGAIADVVIVMAVVPKTESAKGGITAFIVPADAPGVQIEARNQFMGLRGIENSLTSFKDVYVPKENIVGGLGKGLKVALATLNTGRLSLPAIAAASTKHALKISREWASERKQWGKPVGEHDPVAQNIAFIAGTAFGLEAIVDVSSRLADDKANDFRIEAALAKLYASELGWQAVDTMVQVRGGRAYETAASLKNRGEKPVPAEQMLRDMRINRIFEGSTEIMHLLIAREAVDAHLSVAGDILDPKTALADKAKAAVGAGKFYAGWLPTLVTGEGQKPNAFAEFGPLAGHMRYVERSSRKLARSTFGLMGRHQASLEQKGALLGRVVDIGAELYAISCAVVYAQTIVREHPERRDSVNEIADLFCKQARSRAQVTFAELFHNDDATQYVSAKKVLGGEFRWFEADVLDPAGDGPMIPKDAHEVPAKNRADVDAGLVEEQAEAVQ